MKKNTLLLLATSLFALAACGPTNSTDSVPGASTTQGSGSELPAWVDYAATVHLQLDYEGKDFFKDGVGQMKTYYAIDGDTAHFDPMVTTTSSERRIHRGHRALGTVCKQIYQGNTHRSDH